MSTVAVLVAAMIILVIGLSAYAVDSLPEARTSFSVSTTQLSEIHR